jgi:hypothetical protein
MAKWMEANEDLANTPAAADTPAAANEGNSDITYIFFFQLQENPLSRCTYYKYSIT